MTIQEFNYYSDIATKLFNYMNGKINKLNTNCQLFIDSYDRVTNIFAEIKFPSYIHIRIGNIVDSWNDEWSQYMSKEQYLQSVLAWSLSHELHHADQLISMVVYNSNPEYKNKVEIDVEMTSYDWLVQHQDEINYLFGTHIDMRSVDSESLHGENHYQKASVKEFYLQTIANIILKDLDLFYALRVFTNDSLCDDMILVFNDLETVVIKSNGSFIPENVNAFTDLVNRYCAIYNVYSIYADVTIGYNSLGRTVATVQFNVKDQLIYPMSFKK